MKERGRRTISTASLRSSSAFTEEKWIKGKRESGEADVEADDASQQMSESESEEEEE